MATPRQIPFYGKSGIGKSTTSQNTLMELAGMGYRILIAARASFSRRSVVVKSVAGLAAMST